MYSGVFGVANYESTLKIKKFEIADRIGQTKMQNLLDWDDILYAAFLGSLIDAQNSEIHKGRFNMADEKINKLGWNLVLREFWGRWLRIRIWNSEIKNGGSKVADQNEKLLDLDEIWHSDVCRSLITSPSSKFRNSKWRIQYGGKKYKNRLNLDETRYSGNSTFKNEK